MIFKNQIGGNFVFNLVFSASNLTAGQMLFIGDYVESENGCFRLTVKTNGNFVLLQVRTGKIIWEASKTGNY